MIIDESDGTLDATRAIGGYRGVSSKNCKGAIKSLLNAGLTWLANDRGRRSDFPMTGEDLCRVGVVPPRRTCAWRRRSAWPTSSATAITIIRA